jgi:hypothetical protein
MGDMKLPPTMGDMKVPPTMEDKLPKKGASPVPAPVTGNMNYPFIKF